MTDLLTTKLQIFQLNEKDVKDMICLLNDHEFAQADLPEEINSKYIAGLCSEDWGIYKTFTINLNRILAYLDKFCENDELHDHTRNQCDSLLQKIEAAPKSKWKMRARVGEKKR